VIQGVNYDESSDIYSLGIVIYEIFARILPFTNIESIQVIRDVILTDNQIAEPQALGMRMGEFLFMYSLLSLLFKFSRFFENRSFVRHLIILTLEAQGIEYLGGNKGKIRKMNTLVAKDCICRSPGGLRPDTEALAPPLRAFLSTCWNALPAQRPTALQTCAQLGVSRMGGWSFCCCCC
jgi:serine/threonine protein kinase